MQLATNLTTHLTSNAEQKMQALAPAELIELVSKQEHEIAMQGHEIVNLRRQVAWFQRQSERPGEPRATHEICRLG